MTKLGSVDIAALGPGTDSRPASETVVSGDPVFTTWVQDSDPAKSVRSGIWQATPGAFRVENRAVWESFTILEGVVEITEDGGKPETYRTGSNVILRVGFEGIWHTHETIRKFFVVVG